MPIALVNGRISDRTFARLSRLKTLPFGRNLLSLLFSPVSLFCTQSEQDTQRLRDLGVQNERLHTAGNLKFESPEPTRHQALEEQIGRFAAKRALWLAGSTMSGEEEFLLDALKTLPEPTLLVLAPRHPERFEAVFDLCVSRGLNTQKRSDLELGEAPPSALPCDVIVLDTLGELAGLYAVADVAFIGGTLVTTGGHNPLEAARFGTPVVVGPSMENFRAMAELFSQHQAWLQISGPEALAGALGEILGDDALRRALKERSIQLYESNQGALARTCELLKRHGITS